MSLKKAIDLIMAQPPEPHYPAYYADLLRKADVPDKDVGDLISRQQALDCVTYDVEYTIERIKMLPNVQQDMAEKLYLYKCYITDQDGLQHEVIHTDDIRRVTGWEI